MSYHITFDDYLEEIVAEREGVYVGVTDDDYPDKFEHWVTYLEQDDIIKYANEYGEYLAMKNERRV